MTQNCFVSIGHAPSALLLPAISAVAPAPSARPNGGGDDDDDEGGGTPPRCSGSLAAAVVVCCRAAGGAAPPATAPGSLTSVEDALRRPRVLRAAGASSPSVALAHLCSRSGARSGAIGRFCHRWTGPVAVRLLALVDARLARVDIWRRASAGSLLPSAARSLYHTTGASTGTWGGVGRPSAAGSGLGSY